MNLLATQAGGGLYMILVYVVIIGAFMYFSAIRQQKLRHLRNNVSL